MIKRISQTFKIPVFEIMQWDSQELEWQAAFFSIDDNEDRPIIKIDPRHVNVEDSINDLTRLLR